MATKQSHEEISEEVVPRKVPVESKGIKGGRFEDIRKERL